MLKTVAGKRQEAEVTVESEDSLTCSRENQQFFGKCDDRSHEKKRFKNPRDQEPSHCKHGMIMSNCAFCRSSSTCPHGKKQKSKCRECWGSSICIHRRRTSRCNHRFAPMAGKSRHARSAGAHQSAPTASASLDARSVGDHPYVFTAGSNMAARSAGA